MDEKDLVKKAQKGDISAFSELIRIYQQDVFRFIYRRISDHHKSEDATQVVFSRAWKSIKSLLDISRFEGWLFSIAHKVSSDYLENIIKQKEREKPVKDADEIDDKTLQKVADSLEKNEMKEKLEECINTLPDDEKTIIMSHYIDGVTFDEIAVILNMPVSTVKTKCERAKQRLFYCLKSKGVD